MEDKMFWIENPPLFKVGDVVCPREYPEDKMIVDNVVKQSGKAGRAVTYHTRMNGYGIGVTFSEGVLRKYTEPQPKKKRKTKKR